MLFEEYLVCIRGGGDLASGVAYRLSRAGFPVVVLELPRPLVIRRAVSFAEAVYSGEAEVEGVKARLTAGVAEAVAAARTGAVAVLVDPAGYAIPKLKPTVMVDARMLKSSPGDTNPDQALLVIGLGPGYTVGRDCHAVIETNRGHNLGRVLWQGRAEPDTGVPGAVRGQAAERVLRAPAAGSVQSITQIGDPVAGGQLIATVGGEPVRAPFDGVLRGLLHDGVPVSAGHKIGDVDPRGVRRHCFTISDKALAVGGGVVEAILSAPQIRHLRLWRDERARSQG
jgi:xanthine dehydrogenase accessory factor